MAQTSSYTCLAMLLTLELLVLSLRSLSLVEMTVMIPEKQKEAVETTWDVIFHLRVGVRVIFEDINF